MEQIRSFIAIELPDELKAGLTRLQAKLRSEEPSPVKWVNPSGIHLTLKFLGSVAADRIPEINQVMAASTRGIVPFHLEAGGLGVFPNLSRVQVVWVGIKGEMDRLKQLQQQIESNLVPLGFEPESRSFTPHLTVARLRDQATLVERQKFGQLITGAIFEETYIIKVDSISLMRSQLTREGAIYSRLSSVSLKG
jgi:2'-5' RNA ligase